MKLIKKLLKSVDSIQKTLKMRTHREDKVYLKPSIVKSDAVLAQLVEHDLAKVGVTSSSLVYRSKFEVKVFSL